MIGSFCSIGAIGAVNFHMKFVFLDQGFTDRTKEGLALLNSTWRIASMTILATSIAGRLAIGGLADRFSKKWVMTATYFLVAATIPMLLTVSPSRSPVAFAVLFGFGMGADYMLIPLMAAEQFGVNTLARAMAILLPVNTIGQTWFPVLRFDSARALRQLRDRPGRGVRRLDDRRAGHLAAAAPSGRG